MPQYGNDESISKDDPSLNEECEIKENSLEPCKPENSDTFDSLINKQSNSYATFQKTQNETKTNNFNLNDSDTNQQNTKSAERKTLQIKIPKITIPEKKIAEIAIPTLKDKDRYLQKIRKIRSGLSTKIKTNSKFSDHKSNIQNKKSKYVSEFKKLPRNKQIILSALSVFAAIILILAVVMVVSPNTSDNVTDDEKPKPTQTPVSLTDIVNGLHIVKYVEVPVSNVPLKDFIENDIDNSIIVSSNDANVTFKQDLYLLLDKVLYKGDVRDNTSFEKFTVEVYPLIVDPDLGDPDHLSRNKALKVTVMVNDHKNALEKTLQAYETHATEIVREIYQSKYGGEIGVINVIYKGNNDNSVILGFTLNAADAEKYKRMWSDDTHICNYGWSEYDPGNTNKYVLYESYDDSIALKTNTNIANEAQIDQTLENDEYFMNYLVEIYPKLISSLSKINKYYISGDYINAASDANALNKELSGIKDKISKIRVSSSLMKTKVGLMDDIDALITSISKYWYASTFSDSLAVIEAADSITSVLYDLNSIYTDVNLGTYNVEEIITPENYQVLNAKNMNEYVYYRDNSESNDISVRLEDWKSKDSIMVKNLRTASTSTMTSDYGKEYVLATVRVTHMGYRGGSTQRITTPPMSSYSLYYKGYEYKPITISGYMQNDGSPYQTKTLGRREIYDGVIVFEVDKGYPPISFEGDKGYLKLNLGSKYGVQTWNMKKPEYLLGEYYSGTTTTKNSTVDNQTQSTQ